MTLYDKVLGSLLAAAVGDAMGAVTEMRSTRQIVERFGGYVTTLQPPPEDSLARGCPPGFVTDDFSIAYFSARCLLDAQSRPSDALARQALLRWYEDGRYVRFIGPTTLDAICRMRGEENPRRRRRPGLDLDATLLCKNTSATNGAGMKAGIIGLFNPGSLDRAIDETILFCLPTHDNVISLAAACAISAATAKALEPHADYQQVLAAGIYGAEEGSRRAAERARPSAGPNVVRKIQQAIQIGTQHQNHFDTAMSEISQIIGGGLYACEAIPAVFGHIAACEGRTADSVRMGVNGGDDTDTVACMTGCITGALGGENFPAEYLDIIQQANRFDLTGLAEEICAWNAKEGT